MSLPFVTAGQAEKISREVSQEEISKIPTPASGTKWYKHHITRTDGPYENFIVASISESLIGMHFSDNNSVVSFQNNPGQYPSTLNINYNGSYFSLIGINVWDSNESKYVLKTVITDTVTEL